MIALACVAGAALIGFLIGVFAAPKLLTTHWVRRLFLADTGRRIAPPEVQKALKAERRQARKAVAA